MYKILPRFLTYLALFNAVPKNSFIPRPVNTGAVLRTTNFHDWLALKKYHLNAPPPNLLSRKSPIQEQYDKFRQLYPNFSTQLRQRLFTNESTFVTVTYNDFPYDLDSNIIHLVVWYRLDNFNELCLIDILEQLGVDDYIIFTNPPEGKSVKDIEHTHLFLKNYLDVAKVINYRF